MDKKAGILIPTDVSLSDIEVVNGRVGIAPAHYTPTDPDYSESILSPIITKTTDNGGDIQIEAETGYGVTDSLDIPTVRPLIDQDILDAIRSGSFVFKMAGDTGINGKLYNSDLGSVNLQLSRACGIYQDHLVRGSLLWGKSTTTYSGKSRPPVHDFWDTPYFYDSTGTLINTDRISYSRIYSDDNFIYAVCLVRNIASARDTGSVTFFAYDAFERIFKYRGVIGENNDITSSTLYNRGYQTIFNNAISYDMPISPVICRVKNFKNKLVCAYLYVRPNQSSYDNMVMTLKIFESYDDGESWSELSNLGKNYFQDWAFNLNVAPYKLDDLRVRIASNGSDILIVWAALPENVGTNRKYRQMHWLRSRDGGSIWEYDNGNNMSTIFNIGGEGKDKTVSGYNDGFDTNIAFDLTVNSDGLFVLCRVGEGTHYIYPGLPTGGYSTSVGNRCLVFYCAEGGDVLSWKRCGLVNLDVGFDTNIEGLETVVANGNLYGYERSPVDVCLFTDSVHDFDYAIVKMKNYRYLAGDKYRNDSFLTMVRYKSMPVEEWSTYPDWRDTGIGNSNCADYAFMIEPTNRNNAIFHIANEITDRCFNISAVMHRGHILVMMDGYYESVSAHQFTKLFGVFKSWNNMPVNYSNRLTYIPATGTPLQHGFTHVQNADGAAVSITHSPMINRLYYLIPPGTNFVGSANNYESLTKAATVEVPISEDEFIVRFVVQRATQFDAAKFVSIMSLFTYFYDTASSLWRSSTITCYINPAANGFYFTGLQAASFTDSGATAGVEWEYMLIKKRREVVLCRRRWTQEPSSGSVANTSFVNSWTIVFNGTLSSQGAAGALGNSYLQFGCVSTTAGAYASGYSWYFKNITTSRNKTDIYPMKTNYKNYFSGLTAPAMNYSTDRGVLSSEFLWNYTGYTLSGYSALLNSMRGEFISPKPIWIGNNLYTLTDSYYSKYSLLWLTLRKGEAFTNVGNLDIPIIKNCDEVSPIGAYFNGINQYIQCGIHSELALAKNMSIVAWVKCDTAIDGPIITRWDASIGQGYGLFVNFSANRISFIVNNADTYNSDAVFTEDDVWIHIAVTVDNNDRIRFYKNGNLVGEPQTLINPIVQYDDIYTYIGYDDFGSGFYNGYICKPGIFDKCLDRKDIKRMFMENQVGPLVPSDFFVRVFGQDARFGDTWTLSNKFFGSSSDNVIGNIPSTYFLANRDGRYGIVPGGASYGAGDVEVVLQQKLGGAIAANAAAFINCDATDVAIYSKDSNPLSVAWLAGDLRATGQFHMLDAHNDINNISLTSLIDGIGVMTTSIREGLLAGKKVIIYNSAITDHYNIANNPTKHRICRVVYNSGNKIQFDDKTLNLSGLLPGPWNVRILSNNLLVKFTEASNNYWRFIFTNNAFNGKKIRVGLIILGTYLELDDNPDLEFSYSIESQENYKKNEYGNIIRTTYNKQKSILNMNFNMIDTLKLKNTFSLLKTTFMNCSQSGNGIVFCDGFYNAVFSPLVYYCVVDNHVLDTKLVDSVQKNLTLTLREI